jgi:ribose 5-phosphate isomerase B
VKVVIASDHAGVALKAELVAALRSWGLDTVDLGPDSTASVDYPDFAQRVTDAIGRGDAALGVLVCGSGIGMSIAANKRPGIRAALCHHELEATLARQHNDANVLCLGSRFTGSALALAIAQAFVKGQFEGGRHQQRVAKLEVS